MPAFKTVVGPLFSHAFARSTVARDEATYDEIRKLARRLGEHEAVKVAIHRWAALAPSTYLRYVKSLTKLVTHYRAVELPPGHSPFLLLRMAKLRNASHRPRRAWVPPVHVIRKMTTTGRKAMRLLTAMCLVSASRFDDLTLETTRIRVLSPTLIRVSLPVDKGRPLGRKASKFLECPRMIRSAQLPMGRLRFKASYTALMRHLKAIHPQLSAHSMRRAACTLLSRRGWSLSHIQSLTLHSGLQTRSVETVARYVDIHPSMPEARRQRRLSAYLDNLAFPPRH